MWLWVGRAVSPCLQTATEDNSARIQAKVSSRIFKAYATTGHAIPFFRMKGFLRDSNIGVYLILKSPAFPGRL